MFRVLLLLSVLVTLFFAQVAMAQDDGKMTDDSMKSEMMSGEFTATISQGRARIRAGASQESETLGYCQKGDQLTVWLPAVEDWLTASCRGVTGLIHSSLVAVGAAVMPADDAMMMDDAMMDDGKMADKTMDDSMKDEMMAGEFTAVISLGRARIRAGASLESEIIGFCQKGDRLTVWLPSTDDWLTSSCHGVTGFIHSSLVDVGVQAIPTISELGESAGMAMKDDMAMDDM